MAAGWDLMVMPFSRSRSMASRSCAFSSRWATVLVAPIRRSESVVFPWSMCAMIEKLRVSEVGMAGRWGSPAGGEKHGIQGNHGKRKGHRMPGLAWDGDACYGRGVTRRYEIQEIIGQDSNGVVFHAVERSSGRDVVLRRFFPFGASGGGLDRAEQEAYAAAVENL